MEKNTLWAIILSTVVVVGAFYFQSRSAPKQAPLPQNVEKAESAPASGEQEKEAVSSLGISAVQDSEDLAEETYTVETDRLKVTFTNKGGDVIGIELLQQQDGDTGRGIEMADSIHEKNRAFALSFGGYSIANSSINSEIYKVSFTEDKRAIRFSRDYAIKSDDGSEKSFTITKIYRFVDGEYMFKLEIEISGDTAGLDFGGTAYSLYSVPQIGPKYDPKNSRYEYRTFISEIENKRKTKNVNPGQIHAEEFKSECSWLGVTGKYFAALIVPTDSSVIGRRIFSALAEKDSYPNAQVILERKAASGAIKDSFYIYAGPRNEQELGRYNKMESNAWKQHNLKLTDALQTSGILSWLEIVLKFLMESVHNLIPPHNWGIAIIITTLIIKIILFPLTRKTSLSTVRMQALQPQISAIQEKYKGDPQKLNAEMLKFYKEAGYNPMSGCLPMLIQLPILIAMYNLFNNYFEFRGAMFIPGWINDLSKGDTVHSLGFALPVLHWTEIRLLPVIYVISQLLFGKITNNGGATAGQNSKQMKIMMYGMPIFFFFIFYDAPAGLLLYWTVSNMFTLVQQVVINRMLKDSRAQIVVVKKKDDRFPKGKKTTR